MSTAGRMEAPRLVAPRRTPAAAPTTSTPGTKVSTAKTVPPSIDKARQALARARLLRGEYLVALASDLITAHDVVQAAMTDEGKPLRRISLRQLHLSSPGWGERRTKRLLSALSERLGASEKTQDMTIAWLIDPRSGGRRYLAWLDAQQPKAHAPWPGFPYMALKGDR